MKKSHVDYYSLFGISHTASLDDIKRAYRKLALQYHPDKNFNDHKASDKFRVIQEVYETLINPEKRREYDQRLLFYERKKNSQAHFHRREKVRKQQRSESRWKASRRGAKGHDLRYTLSLSLEEAALGTKKEIHFVRRREGREDTAKLFVTIPSGVIEGQNLRLKGEGESLHSGEIPGDLYVIVFLKNHPLFQRQNDHVSMILPLSFLDAVLGVTVDIPTLWGQSSLTIPPFTCSETIFCLKKKGFPSSGGKFHGDMLIKVVVDIPRQLNRKELKKLKEIDKDTLRRACPLVDEFEEKVKNLFSQKEQDDQSWQKRKWG